MAKLQKVNEEKGELKRNHSAGLREPNRKFQWGYAGYKPGQLKKKQQQQTSHQTDMAVVFKTFATSYQLYYNILAVYYTLS